MSNPFALRHTLTLPKGRGALEKAQAEKPGAAGEEARSTLWQALVFCFQPRLFRLIYSKRGGGEKKGHSDSLEGNAEERLVIGGYDAGLTRRKTQSGTALLKCSLAGDFTTCVLDSFVFVAGDI